ncbi:transposase [Fusibacter bizertensis]
MLGWVKITIETKQKDSVCPCCGQLTRKIHDSRYQTIKDFPFMHKKNLLILKKRRYVCACGEKYQCILVDLKSNPIFDILADRKQSHLIDYIKSYSRHERQKVQFFICDMWKQYAELARLFFPNATIIVDKYHFIRQVTWAIENIRKRVQKNMPADLRQTYRLKETFYQICQNRKYSEQRKDFYEWISYAKSQNIEEFKAFITAFRKGAGIIKSPPQLLT